MTTGWGIQTETDRRRETIPMRRPIKQKPKRNSLTPSTMSRDLDWLVDQWRTSRPEDRLQLVLAKIRAEEKMAEPAPAV